MYYNKIIQFLSDTYQSSQQNERVMIKLYKKKGKWVDFYKLFEIVMVNSTNHFMYKKATAIGASIMTRGIKGNIKFFCIP